MTEPRYYKFLNRDGSPCHGGFGKWHLPKNGKPGRWMPKIKGDLAPCENGYHIVRGEHLPRWIGPALYRVEYDGEIVHDDEKSVVRRARLLSPVETYTDALLRHFACDCAERALKRAEVTDRRSWKAIEVARAFADAKASSEDLAAAWDAARAAARAAAWAAAEDAAWDAAWAAAEDAENKWQADHLLTLLGEAEGFPPKPPPEAA